MNATADRPRYLAPDRFTAKVFNPAVAWFTRHGLSLKGSRVLTVRGRTTGEPRTTPVNLLTVDGVDYLVSPRGNTQWARNARAAGEVELGPRWRRTPVTLTEVDDDAKPALLKSYLDRWYWEVKGHIAGLTPESTAAELRSAAPVIPVFALAR